MKDRDDFVRQMREEIIEWRAKLDELKVQAALGKMEARDRYEEMLVDLHRGVEESEEKLHRVSVSAGDAWSEIGDGFKHAWADVKQGIRNAMSHKKTSDKSHGASGGA